jgi:dihydrofolate reductase
MGKTLYSAAMSLDGFITGPDGDMSWLSEFLGPNPVVDELVESIGALYIGKRTFGGDDPHKGTEGEGQAFGGGWSGPQFVLTHRAPEWDVPGVTFVDDFARGLAAAKEAAGEKYVNLLGASIARQGIEAGELDEVLVGIVPLLLGEGTRLFEYPGGKSVKLERISVSHVPHATNLWFRVVK